MKRHNRISILILMAITLTGLPFLAMAESFDQDQIAKMVQEKIDEKNYTRIPNKDFDSLVEYKIAKILDAKLSSWLALIVSFLAMVGGLVVVAMNKFLNDAVTKNVKSAISEKSKELENLIEAKYHKDRGEIDSIQGYINSNKNILYEIQLQKIKEEINRNPNSEKSASSLAVLLENVQQIEDSDLFANTLDELVIHYYRQSKDKEIESLMNKYFNNNNILFTTYFTASLPHFNSYEGTSSKGERNKALEYLNKSLEKEPTYGVALAVKLELFMMDYSKENTDLSKKQALENANEVFTQALATLVSSNETLNRLIKDRSVSRFTKYVELLFRLFADKISELEHKARLGDEYLVASKSNDKDKMDDILKRFYESNDFENAQDTETILQDNKSMELDSNTATLK